MTDEVIAQEASKQVENVGNVTQEAGSTQEKETTTDPYEETARSQGWKPLEEYEGDKAKWRGSKEFVERGELFNKMDSINKDLKDTRKALKMLQEHHTKVKETEYNNALKELKALQKRHLEEGNSDGYLETTDLLTDLKAEQKAREVVQETTPAQPDPRFTAWVNENRWYSSNQEMREFADTLGIGYRERNPDKDPEDILRYVTEQVRTKFKERFTNPNRNKPSSVEGTSAPAGKKDSFELTQEERKVMNAFVRTGAMTAEEYINDLKKIRGVK